MFDTMIETDTPTRDHEPEADHHTRQIVVEIETSVVVNQDEMVTATVVMRTRVEATFMAMET
jgi:hypothetical protein